jgi:O-antigen ligase
MMEAAIDAPAPAAEGIGARAVRAAYFAFVLWIPVETVYTFDTKDDASKSGVTISKLLGLLLFGMAVIEWRRCFRKIPRSFWMVAWYLGVFALSQLWIPRQLDAKFRSSQLTMIQMVALFVVSANLFDDAAFRAALLRFYGWWSALVGAAMLLGVLGHQFEDVEGRYTLLGEDPNFTAGMFALGAICIAGNAKLSESKGFFLRLAAALLAIGGLTAAILQTGSRGGLLAFIAGILGLAACAGKGVRKRRALIAGAVVLLLGGLVVLEFQHGTTASVRLKHAWEDGDTAGRTDIWEVSRRMVSKRPLLGYGGVNNFYALGAELNFSEGGAGYYRDTHNLLLAVLTEVGLVGGLPFVAGILYAFWAAWRYGRRTDDGVPFALMCVLLMMNSSITGYHQKIFWVVVAAAAACGMEERAARM